MVDKHVEWTWMVMTTAEVGSKAKKKTIGGGKRGEKQWRRGWMMRGKG